MSAKQQFSSVWERRAAREGAGRDRREQPALNEAQIVRAAIELLDAEGLEALTMRRLGAKLAAGATSLYWYVATKDELLDLVLDEAFGEIRLGGGEVSWQNAASAFAHSLRQMMLRHPWVVRLLGSRPNIGPNSLRLAEWLITLFQDAGFPASDIDNATTTLMAYVIGMASTEAAWHQALARSGTSARELQERIRPVLEAQLDDLPRARALYRECLDLDPLINQEIRFDYGLTCVLDGLAARLAQPVPQPPRQPSSPSAAGNTPDGG